MLSVVTNYDLLNYLTDIEAQIADIQSKKKEVQKTAGDGVSLLASGNFFDTEFYDEGKGKNRYEGYNTSIAANEDVDEDEDEGIVTQKRVAYTAPKSVMKDVIQVSGHFIHGKT